MRKLRLAGCISALLLAGCGSDPIETVKNDIFVFEGSYTNDQIYSTRAFCETSNWSTREDSRGRTVIDNVCEISGVKDSYNQVLAQLTAKRKATLKDTVDYYNSEILKHLNYVDQIDLLVEGDVVSEELRTFAAGALRETDVPCDFLNNSSTESFDEIKSGCSDSAIAHIEAFTNQMVRAEETASKDLAEIEDLKISMPDKLYETTSWVIVGKGDEEQVEYVQTKLDLITVDLITVNIHLADKPYINELINGAVHDASSYINKVSKYPIKVYDHGLYYNNPKYKLGHVWTYDS
ncbi:hypothetical protein LRP49_03735 [Enterovibrio sp. ZSDZ35]|uniref:LPP20 lipoprotein n=1 Tax=Enterovibrio qingdaonensis TaxID=2899818 RepID=A0ABT5QH43_9GAMM|nr:hypothetical protein [Enterovibrio sp. ZSDZ35]MDD1780305.1 hypothetical protein [Enterovibrio sp. ZSDZ35]